MKQQKRTPYGLGRLYKKKGAKEYPASDPVRAPYWLQHSIGGRRVREALTKPDGTPIMNLREAEARRAEIRAPYLNKRHTNIREAILEDIATTDTHVTETLRFNESFSRFVASPLRPDCGDSTLRQYKYQYERFVKWATKRGLADVARVTDADAARYMEELTADLSAATVNKHINLLSLVWRCLEIAEDPWSADKLQRRRHRPQRREALTDAQIAALLARAEGEMYTLIMLGALTGLRLGDCAQLKSNEVDLDSRMITRRTLKQRRGSDKLVHIPILPELAEHLATLDLNGQFVLPDCARIHISRSDTLTDRVQRLLWDCGIECHAPGTGMQLVRDSDGKPVWAKIHNALEHTGRRAVVQYGFHSLRHAFVSRCARAGIPLAIVQSIVGHACPALTIYYTHLSNDVLTAAMERLPKLSATEYRKT